MSVRRTVVYNVSNIPSATHHHRNHHYKSWQPAKTSIVSTPHFFPLQICRLSDEDILLWFNSQWFIQEMQGTASDEDALLQLYMSSCTQWPTQENSYFGFFSYMLSNGLKLVVFMFFPWCYDRNLSSLKFAHLYITTSMPYRDFMWFQESFSVQLHTNSISSKAFLLNIHLAPTRKAIKTQRKLELSHIYVFTASSLEFTKITGCLKKNELWKYMYRYTYSEFLQEQTSMMVIISVPAETESSHLTLEAAKLRWCHITVKWDSIASHTKTTLNTFRHGKGQKKQR